MAAVIKIDIIDAQLKLRREFKHLTDSQFNLAVARSLNAMASRLKTASKREALKHYKISASEFNVNKNTGIGKASRNDLTAKLGIAMRPFPVMAFGPVISDKGVYVTIMGRTKLIKHAFVATMNSGHTGIFARGKYKNVKDFQWNKQRQKAPTLFRNINGRNIPIGPNDLPVDEIKTASPYSMVTNTPVLQSLSNRLETDFPNRLLKQLAKVERGY